MENLSSSPVMKLTRAALVKHRASSSVRCRQDVKEVSRAGCINTTFECSHGRRRGELRPLASTRRPPCSSASTEFSGRQPSRRAQGPPSLVETPQNQGRTRSGADNVPLGAGGRLVSRGGLDRRSLLRSGRLQVTTDGRV